MFTLVQERHHKREINFPKNENSALAGKRTKKKWYPFYEHTIAMTMTRECLCIVYASEFDPLKTLRWLAAIQCQAKTKKKSTTQESSLFMLCAGVCDKKIDISEVEDEKSCGIRISKLHKFTSDLGFNEAKARRWKKENKRASKFWYFRQWNVWKVFLINSSFWWLGILRKSKFVYLQSIVHICANSYHTQRWKCFGNEKNI